jgi:hypothetical protein
MAATKPAESTHCTGCGKRLPTYTRITLPRAQTGDLVFCGFACLTAWKQDGSPT